MSKHRFTDLISGWKAQYLLGGSIELLEIHELKEHPYLRDLPFFSSITEVHVEQGEINFLVARISEKMFISVSRHKQKCNLGICEMY
ncbi:MAG: hypothetical protein ABJG41_00215 [Cyclobacteriaceae bacterium]